MSRLSKGEHRAWARPGLLAIAALTALAYVWDANGAMLEPFYGAAARSMSGSWHDFLFAAFDPLGTVSVDKLPGALWLQALSLRIFGFHIWAIVLPQIIEGVATIFIVDRVARRLAGPLAGTAAALTLAAIPVTVSTARGNVSDTLLILLTVLAADAATVAVLEDRRRPLLMTGLWLGLAFQAKMLQAWLIFPALALAYLLCSRTPWPARWMRLGLCAAVMIVVSLSWMSVVSLIPAHDRPYVDGSPNDSLFDQVFDYNGFGRLGRSELIASIGRPTPFLTALAHNPELEAVSTAIIRPSWHRLLARPLGRDVGWVLPAALVALLVVAWERRRSGWRDPVRAGVVLWGAWLLLLGLSFSFGAYVNSYYLAALSPGLAVLCGLGAEVCWRRRADRRIRLAVAAALLATAGYGIYLSGPGGHVPGWVLPVCLTLTAAGLVAVGFRRDLRIALGVLLAFAAAASATVVIDDHGPFDVPYGARTYTGSPSRAAAIYQTLVLDLQRGAGGGHQRIVQATYTSAFAAPQIFYTGREFLPIGGYRGEVPSPTVRQIARDVADGELHFAYVPTAPSAEDPRVRWLRDHCSSGPGPSTFGIRFAFITCTRADAN